MNKLCECGCGVTTKVPQYTDKSKGWTVGVPLRFLKGHNFKRGTRGSEHYNWKGGRHLHSNGYVLLWMPDGSRKYEHIIIAERALGRALKQFGKGDARNEVVHHIDGDKTNNAKSNLLICTHAYHTALHVRLERSADWPQFLPRDILAKAWIANRKAWADPAHRAARIEAIKESWRRRRG